VRLLSKDRTVTRRFVNAWVALSTLGMGILVLATGASAAVKYDVVNMTANASSVHLIANSNAFPNFRTGAIDVSYAYAHSHVDGSPFSQGRASPFDTGPVVQLQVAEHSCDLKNAIVDNGLPVPPPDCFEQPQYTDVRFPPSNAKPETFGQSGGPFAESYARENYAFAQSVEAGDSGEKPQTSEQPNPNTPGAPIPAPSSSGIPAAPSGSTAGAPTINILPMAYHAVLNPLSGTLSKLNTAILAWRARWLTADDARRYPVALADAAEPDGQDGMAAITETNFDSKTGALMSRGDSRVARVSLGGGAIVLKGVHTKVITTDDGTEPKTQTVIEIASAEVGGVPVTIGPNGVSVNGTQVPGIGDAVQQASGQLNGALAQAGYVIEALKPTLKKSAGQLTVDASAAHIHFVQPQVAPGVPIVFYDLYLGEVFVDQLGTVSTAVGGGLGGGSNIGGGGSQFIPGTQGIPGSPGTSGTSGTTGPGGGLTKLLHSKPAYLLLLYAMWQVLILGTAASLWWMRMGGPA
jgi:hypothetical protein